MYIYTLYVQKKYKCQSFRFGKEYFLIYAPVTENSKAIICTRPNSKYILRHFTMELFLLFFRREVIKDIASG